MLQSLGSSEGNKRNVRVPRVNRTLYFTLCCVVGVLIAAAVHFNGSAIQSLLNFGSAQPPVEGDISGNFLSRSDHPSLPISFADGIKIASPSVVSVYTVLTGSTENQNPQDQDGRQANQGSGVIIDSSGLVVTSNHLIDGAENIYIALADNNVFEARLIGRDLDTDLALIQIQTIEPLPALQLMTDFTPEVGDVVLAIGNPYGVGQTVTMGIISAVRRKLTGVSPLQNFMQIDAAINPGNSGGALINAEGELLGINTAIFSRLDGAQGIGFVIPANVVEWIVPQLLTHGRVIRGWLGIAAQDLINFPELFGANTNGAVVVGLSEDGPASMAGIEVGDIVVSINQNPVLRADNLLTDVATGLPGGTVQLGIQRGALELIVDVVLGQRPEVVGIQDEQLQ